ncbi:MAG: prolyl oligopeptidase family serine peptidase, partial [Bacteroidales bacterium]|nr:prolyl oligopeptidase family serine peptidase [Bacteroidales bacterium]
MKHMTSFFLLLFLAVIYKTGTIQAQKPIDHSVYNNWKQLSKQVISPDGKQIAYVINPFKGDGMLYLYRNKNGSTDSVARGTEPKFSFSSTVLVYKIKPQYDTLRTAKLKKVKKDKLPKDSLGIWLLSEGRHIKFPRLKSYQLPEGKTDWLAVFFEDSRLSDAKRDTLAADSLSVEKKPKEKKYGDCLILLNPITGDSIRLSGVKQYTFSKNGSACAIVQVQADSIDSVFVSVFDTKKKILDTLFSAPGLSKSITLDEVGSQLAFTYSQETGKTKVYELYYLNLKKNMPPLCPSCDKADALPGGWSVSEYADLYFNTAGSELYFGTAPRPEPEPEDTLTADEKVCLDIWNWKDPYLQPHQLKQVEKEKKRNYAAVYFPKKDIVIQLAAVDLKNVQLDKKAEGMLSLAFDDNPYRQMLSWDGSRYRDVYLVNRMTGEHRQILQKAASVVSLSPKQQFVAWYNIADSSWNIYSIREKQSRRLKAQSGVCFYDERNDVPNEANPYGLAGWTQNEKPVVYDRYDMWLFDPSGRQQARNITRGEGRKQHIRFRYVKLDKELRFLPDQMLLSAFVETNKQSGFFKLDLKSGSLEQLVLEDFAFGKPQKAKEADVLLWRKESFRLYPDLYVSDVSFQQAKKISTTNPQQKEYLWGTVELVNWRTFNGDSLSGLLYKPADFDPNKKYPMLVYFYERYTDRLHRHYVPKPIRSVINFTYYTSNGYLIFIPDIVYKTGYPGPSAYDCIVSGTQAMLEEHPFIDRERLGIQGQSWGGYQTAYVITQTNMFRAAMAGAPVSNMTSAYGGIRWGSGLSRAFQYEQTQSRIGGTLWEKRD